MGSFYIGGQLLIEPAADREAAVDEIGAVFAPRCRPKTLPDPLETGEKLGQERLQRNPAGDDHRPEGFREVVRPPTEFVRIVERVGEEPRRGAGIGVKGPEGLMVADGAGDAGALFIAKGEGGQNPGRFFRTPLGVVLLRPPDVVEEAGQVGDEDKPPDACIRGRPPLPRSGSTRRHRWPPSGRG